MQKKGKATTTNQEASTLVRWLGTRPLWIELGLAALTVLFGLQTLRVFVPSLFWVLSSRMGWGAIEVGLIGFLVFLTAFLALLFRRPASHRRTIMVTASGLGILRLMMQVWWGEPIFNLVLATVGTAFFAIFLPTYLDAARLRGGPAMSRFALGLLVGLILDTAIHGAFGTYDTAWQVGLLPILLTVLLVVVQWMALRSFLGTTKADAPAAGVSRPKAWPWLAIGPFLFLQLIALQNIPLVATLTGWPPPIAFGLVLLAQLAGLAVAIWLLLNMQRSLWPWALGFGTGLVLVLALACQQAGLLAALLLLVGQILISALIVIVLIGVGASTQTTGRSRIATANGVGFVLILVFLLAYYAVYDLSLPYTNTIIPPIAAFIVAICALGAPLAASREIEVDPKAWAVPVLALLLLVSPLVGAITWRAPQAVPGEGFPVRIMTYNLHNGFNTNGHLDMEALAQVIEESDPDIVALQEISRGWVISGRLDMLMWLSQRLRMPYIFGPTADPIWGNAILSRYPIAGYTQHELPPRDIRLLRGFTAVQVDVGNGTQLQLIATHFHDPEADTDVRQLQSQAILDFWDGADLTVLLGDLNSRPDDREMEMLRQAGLVDAAAAVGGTPGLTYSSLEPEKRIDYIWVSPDLKVIDAESPATTASDHLPVVAVIDK